MASRKGIVLAGGTGSRLHPLTSVISKQLLPVYDKPMIYYSVAVLMLANVREILLITTPNQQSLFEELLGDGSQWGVEFHYAQQAQPRGIAESLLIGEPFIGQDSIALILGDNLFYGQGLQRMLTTPAERGATIFAYRVKDPQRYGVVELDSEGKPIGLHEKPTQPRSPYAVTGLYFFDGRAIEFAKQISASARGELEITDINQCYMDAGELHVNMFSRGLAWFDTGTYDSLLQAANFVEAIANRQGLRMCCPEEIAYRKKWITREALVKLSQEMRSDYGDYLLSISCESQDL